MTPEEFSRTVLDAVRELCAFADEEAVAAFLLAEGIRGVRFNSCDCPVARFVAKRIGPRPDGTLSITVGAAAVTALDYSGEADESGLALCHAFVGFTQPVKGFIHGFDNYNQFSNLEAAV